MNHDEQSTKPAATPIAPEEVDALVGTRDYWSGQYRPRGNPPPSFLRSEGAATLWDITLLNGDVLASVRLHSFIRNTEAVPLLLHLEDGRQVPWSAIAYVTVSQP